MLRRLQSLLNKNDRNDQNTSFYHKNHLYSQESIQLSSSTVDIDQQVQIGIQEHELGHLEKATHCFRLASSEGCPIGMFLYGISLRHGWGCRSNTYLAFQYLQTAAEHAIKDVLQDNLASSKGELIMAIYELGVSFQQGWGVAKNKETAFYYFEIAANLGDLDAMNELAFCYAHGHGVKKNIYKAAKYYRMAARQGQEQIGNSWIWKTKYDVVDDPNWNN